MDADHGDDDRTLAGSPLADAIETVAETRPVDRAEAREVLQSVAEDGVVTWDGVETRLDQAAEAVSKSESEFETVREDIDAARGTADPVADLDIVAARFEGLEDRFEQLEARVADLGVTLENLRTQLVDRRDLFELARQAATLEDNAGRTRTTAEEFMADLESLREWLGNAALRHRSLEGDLDALERAIGELAEAIRNLEARGDHSTPKAGDATGAGDYSSPFEEASTAVDETTGTADLELGAIWFDARLQQLVFDLLLADARAEYEELVEWADRVESAPAPPAAIGDRLEQLSARCEELDEDLDRLARGEWRDEYGDEVERFEHGLATFEAPVDWGTVRSALENLRPAGSQSGQE